MITWIVILICAGLFFWLRNKLRLIEDIADDIYDIKKKLGLKAEPRTKNKYYHERRAELASDIQKEIALQQGDIEKAISFVKNTFSGEISKYMSEKQIMDLADYAKGCVKENQEQIQWLVDQGRSYKEICEAFKGENEYRQGWYNYALKFVSPPIPIESPES